MANKLNILYLHSHDTGRYIQPYGYRVETPRLQRLAAEGVLFRRAYCGNPTCSPSRAVLLTGMYAHANGMLGLAHRGFAMNDYDQHLVRLLKKSGYETALAGIQHEAHRTGETPAWQVIGYDECLSDATEAHTAAADFLLARGKDGRAAEANAAPFFLSVGFFETHREFPIEHPSVDARYVAPPLPLPDTPEIREDMARFMESAKTLDQKIGYVLDALDRAGLRESTIVIATTDHGIAFPSMKCNLTDAGIGVMLIMRGPGGFTGGKAIDALVSHIDIAPTLFELVGLERHPQFQGVSLLPLVREKEPATAVRTEVFAEVNFHAAEEPQRCVRTERWKYIRRFPIGLAPGKLTPVLANCDDSLSKDVWLSVGWDVTPRAHEELYDLILDPVERNNLAPSSAHAEIRSELRARLDAWMRETGDPLADSLLPLPAAAVLNSSEDLSPKAATTTGTRPTGSPR